MSKRQNKQIRNYSKVQPLEILGLFASLFYLHSLNTNFHHYSIGQGVGHPDVYTLLFALAVTAFYLYKRKSLSQIATVTLTVLATVSAVWLFGFNTNFF